MTMKEKDSYVFQKRKTPATDFLINVTPLYVLKTLLHQCRILIKIVPPSEGIMVLNFLSEDVCACTKCACV